jgi:hypothetical protein
MFFRLLDSPEGFERSVPRFGRVQAALNVLRNVSLKVVTQLFIQLVFELISVDQCPPPPL